MRFHLCLIAILTLTLPSFSSERPNIVLIMADDMGYTDIGCYGGEIETPNIDRLAANGLRFTSFYNNAKCGPTRLSLHTGHYASGGLKGKATFAEVLRSAGYHTIMTGKWHQKGLPTDHGYDRYTGLLDGCCNFWNPGIEARPGEPIPGRKPQMVDPDVPRVWGIEDQAIPGYVPEDPDFYTTDVFSDYAVDRLEEHRGSDAPFLLYLAYNVPHYPLHAWPEDVEKYANTYTAGWDSFRERRLAGIKKKGLFPDDLPLPPREDRIDPWNNLTPDEQAAESLKMAVYAAMIDRMDQGIGKVLAKVEELGESDNTIVLFLSDNGAASENPNQDESIPPGPVEGYRATGPGWANVSNTPFRSFKATSHEGGTRTPMIAYWPGVTEPGSITDELGHVIDFLPTFMEIADADYPSEIRGEQTDRPVGKSLVRVFHGQGRKDHQQLFFERSSTRALIEQPWKLVRAKEEDAPWELYNLSSDPNELLDLAEKYPERVAQMADAIAEWEK